MPDGRTSSMRNNARTKFYQCSRARVREVAGLRFRSDRPSRVSESPSAPFGRAGYLVQDCLPPSLASIFGLACALRWCERAIFVFARELVGGSLHCVVCRRIPCCPMLVPWSRLPRLTSSLSSRPWSRFASLATRAAIAGSALPAASRSIRRARSRSISRRVASVASPSKLLDSSLGACWATCH